MWVGEAVCNGKMWRSGRLVNWRRSDMSSRKVRDGRGVQLSVPLWVTVLYK